MSEEFATESERRKAFIAKMRAQSDLLAAQIDDDRNIHALDARKCSGVVKDQVVAALDARLTNLACASASNPMQLSRAALATRAGQPREIRPSEPHATEQSA